jgi:hypothetical protein
MFIVIAKYFLWRLGILTKNLLGWGGVLGGEYWSGVDEK